tara:strand:+ start:363 stop:716 length:354 start_codon:yes stop_codon:yes gene_type:complete
MRMPITIKYAAGDIDPYQLENLLGFIPHYFPPYSEEGENLKDFVDHGYQHTAGFSPSWRENPKTKLSADGLYEYPEDPPMTPLMVVTHGDETFYLYEYALAAYRSSPDAAPEYTRLD